MQMPTPSVEGKANAYDDLPSVWQRKCEAGRDLAYWVRPAIRHRTTPANVCLSATIAGIRSGNPARKLWGWACFVGQTLVMQGP